MRYAAITDRGTYEDSKEVVYGESDTVNGAIWAGLWYSMGTLDNETYFDFPGIWDYEKDKWVIMSILDIL